MHPVPHGSRGFRTLLNTVDPNNKQLEAGFCTPIDARTSGNLELVVAQVQPQARVGRGARGGGEEGVFFILFRPKICGNFGRHCV